MVRMRFAVSLFARCLAVMSGFCYAPTLFAQNPLLDDVTTRIEGSTAEVRIQFTMPVQYLYHFPVEHGDLVLIFFRVVTVNGDDISLREVVRRIRATANLPGFTVTYVHPPSHDFVFDPLSVLIEFDRPVRYSVSAGKDKRSLYLTIPLAAEPSER